MLKLKHLAPRHGFEPRFTAPKAAVLPLDDRGITLNNVLDQCSVQAATNRAHQLCLSRGAAQRFGFERLIPQVRRLQEQHPSPQRSGAKPNIDAIR